MLYVSESLPTPSSMSSGREASSRRWKEHRQLEINHLLKKPYIVQSCAEAIKQPVTAIASDAFSKRCKHEYCSRHEYGTTPAQQ